MLSAVGALAFPLPKVTHFSVALPPCILPIWCPLPGHLLQEALQADPGCVYPADLSSFVGRLRMHPLFVLLMGNGWAGFNMPALFSRGLCIAIF